VPDGGGQSDADADAVNADPAIKGERERWGNFQLGLRSVGRGGDGGGLHGTNALQSDK
jgi:hypothetical protein